MIKVINSTDNNITKTIFSSWEKNETLVIAHEDTLDLEYKEEYMGESGLIIFTSGTTGKPKAVVIPWAAIDSRCRAAGELFNISSDSVTLTTMSSVVVPECHSILLETYRRGGKVLFKKDIINNPMLATEATILFAVPSLNPPEFRADNLEFVIFSTVMTEVKQQQVAQDWSKNAKIVTWYGSREVGGVAVSSGENLECGYVGKTTPGMETRTVDGVLQVRGPQIGSGYIDRPFPMDGEWFIMGDYAEKAEDGSIRILGRVEPRF